MDRVGKHFISRNALPVMTFFELQMVQLLGSRSKIPFIFSTGNSFLWPIRESACLKQYFYIHPFISFFISHCFIRLLYFFHHEAITCTFVFLKDFLFFLINVCSVAIHLIACWFSSWLIIFLTPMGKINGNVWPLMHSIPFNVIPIQLPSMPVQFKIHTQIPSQSFDSDFCT